MSGVDFEMVDRKIRVITEAVESGECFHINEKYKEVMTEIRNLSTLVTIKYMEESEE